jgi:hypothetical protein
MADVTITGLPNASALSGTERVPMDQGGVTVGLGNADNTSDANKPISTATQTALDGKAAIGPIGSSGVTMTAGVLGRESGTGAPQVYPLGSGLSIVAGALTVTATGSGTVTSVGLSVPTGFAVANSPITTSGTLALSFAAGYSLPLTATQASWDAAAVLAGTAVQPAGLASTLTGYVQTSDARLSDSREWSATTISQAEAEAGVGTTRRAFTAQRVFQAAAAWWSGFASATGQALATAANAAAARTAIGAGTDVDVYKVPIGDEGTAITAGTNKVRFKADFPGTLVAVRAGVNTAPTGSTLIVDINKNGVSMLGTKLSIDANETSSATAASAATITTTSIADDDEISIDIDQPGTTVAGAGLKVSLFVRRT